MHDTIVAIATAHGVGSVAIVRISGTRAHEIACKLTNKEELRVRHATLSDVYDTHGKLLDEAILLYFQAPHSFTAEDVVEVQCHGGFVVAKTILNAVVACGARIADPGEFSRRAFLNGRIDLSEAEAIAKLIEAKSEDAAKILASQMKGSLRHYVESLRDAIINVLAYSEVSIDYAEEDLPADLIEQMMQKLKQIENNLQKTLDVSKSREGLMQGFRVAIIGKPNVGKSSLLNALLHYERAIVSEIAGTTRDTIEEQLRIGTHLVRIIDTAGIRDAGDVIERIGVERSFEMIAQSDIIVALFDGSRVCDDEDEAIIAHLKECSAHKDIIYVKNKNDLASLFHHEDVIFSLSLNLKESAATLVAKLEELMDGKNISDEMMLISARQIGAVALTLQNIQDAHEPLQNQELEIFSFHLTHAIKAIASITRPFENDEMLDAMFSSFCLGK